MDIIIVYFSKSFWAFIKEVINMNELIQTTSNEIIIHSKAGRVHHNIIKIAKEYMQNNYRRNIHIKDIAAVTGATYSHFSTIFKNLTGESASFHLKQIRVKEACRLLLETDKSLYDIAISCGFHNVSYFYLPFRKITGFTPAQYRKRKKDMG
jgi:AraC-like DNA-binding protein